MSTAARIAEWWARLGGSRPGRSTFARLIAIAIPYSGSIRPHIVELAPGYARVLLRDRRRVRNHLGSVHAVALTNLGELTSGLALVPWLENARGIVVQISTTYQKKARGTLTAEARCTVPQVAAAMEQETKAEIRDAAGDVVAVVTAHWRLAPIPGATDPPRDD